MKLLLTVTSIVEGLTGMALMIAPSPVVLILLGVPPDGAMAMLLARLAGAALISLGIACLLSRNNEAAPAVIKAMLFYNSVAAAVLLYASIGYQFEGAGLIPAVLAHVGLTVWCVISLVQDKKTFKNN